MEASPLHALRRAAARLLAPDADAAQHRSAAIDVARLLAAALPPPSWRRGAVAEAGTRTAHGLALSPALAAACAGDPLRLAAFVRGAHEAIITRRRVDASRPVRVLYVGCGPYATLAMPLTAALPPEVVRFDLIDLQAESIDSARAAVEALGLGRSVERFEAGDAPRWQPLPGRRPDLFLLEVMQA